jgi:hypothetical protein
MLPPIQDIYSKQWLRKAHSIKDLAHPSHELVHSFTVGQTVSEHKA